MLANFIVSMWIYKAMDILKLILLLIEDWGTLKLTTISD